MNEPLSYFVKYKESVDRATIRTEETELLNKINNVIETTLSDSISVVDLTSQFNVIKHELDKFNVLLDNTKNEIESCLRRKEKSYLSKSYTLYEEANETPEYILERSKAHPLVLDNDIKKELIHNISEHCSWKYPGLVIRPNDMDLIAPLTSLDPLYVLEEDVTLLSFIKSQWSEKYQSRLRYNIINDNDATIFKNIPQAQIGFVLITDFFNYKPLEIIKKYSREVFDVLRPGGTMLFTYNNCNLSTSVKLFEHMFRSYTPKSLVVPILELIGFEITSTFDDPNTSTSWIIVKKPGTVSTLRGGQCLAKINV